jgi:hypothetical protein
MWEITARSWTTAQDAAPNIAVQNLLSSLAHQPRFPVLRMERIMECFLWFRFENSMGVFAALGWELYYLFREVLILSGDPKNSDLKELRHQVYGDMGEDRCDALVRRCTTAPLQKRIGDGRAARQSTPFLFHNPKKQQRGKAASEEGANRWLGSRVAPCVRAGGTLGATLRGWRKHTVLSTLHRRPERLGSFPAHFPQNRLSSARTRSTTNRRALQPR